MRTKTPKTNKIKRTKTSQQKPDKAEVKRTKKKKMKCSKEVPCGGCTPNPPDDPGYCQYYSIGYCKVSPCVEMTVCAFYCKKNLTCPAYQDAKKALKVQQQKDISIREEQAKAAVAEKEPKKKKEKAPATAAVKRTKKRAK